MGCGCGGRKTKTVVKAPCAQAQRAIQVRSGVIAQVIRPMTTARSIQRRCPKCKWPMSSARRFSGNISVQIWTCLNRKCMFREES